MKPTTKTLAKADHKPTMIWTLKINLIFGLYASEPWEAVLEINSTATLEDLHCAIQSAVGFDDDHMYTFYVARTEHSRDRTMFDPEDDSVFETTVAKLFPLPKHRKLFYWFDFGDDWKFSIARMRTAPQIAVKRRKYPRVVSTRGKRPVQYPPYD